MQRHLKLLTEHLQIPAGSHLLISQIDDAELIAQLARHHMLSVFHRDYAVNCRLRAALTNDRQIEFHNLPMEDAEQKYDAALLQIPKSRGFAQALLYTGLRALKVGGTLYALGATHGGGNTAMTDAAKLAPTHPIASRARYRLFSVDRPEYLVAPDYWDQPWQPRVIEMHVAGRCYSVATQPGIFSWNMPDEGTCFLIEHLAQLRQGRCECILDAGCGYGLLGMAARSHFSPRRLVLADTDLLAMECVRANLPAAEMVVHDLTQSPLTGSKFDLILCNPPFHQGLEKDISFMRHFPVYARQMLANNGQLAIVANSFLPYRNLLAEHFQSVSKLNDNGRFQILLAGDDTPAP